MNKNMVVILLLFALGGCTKNYKVAPLKPLKKDQAHFIQVQVHTEDFLIKHSVISGKNRRTHPQED